MRQDLHHDMRHETRHHTRHHPSAVPPCEPTGPVVRGPRRRVAVVGSGISGLAAAWHLSADAEVTLYEADSRHGGHSHTVDVALDGVRHPVDTGFLVFNERTYPALIALFAALRVETVPSDMSFSVQAPADGLEWSGSALLSVFAQRRNALRPAFWRMLADVLRFNALATALARSDAADARWQQPIGDFLREHRFGRAFADWYFLPMIASIWSCPTRQMLAFPVETLVRFCDNHGLLQVRDRPRWFTVRGGSRTYVEAMLPRIQRVLRSTPVRAVRRLPTGGAMVCTDHGEQHYDSVVLACHSDQSLALLGGGASAAERSVLGAIGYQRNLAVLHTDASVLPQRRRAWAAWNYASGAAAGRSTDAPGATRSPTAADGDPAVCLHYLINRLQPIATQTPVIVTLNPVRPLDRAAVHGEYDYAHPVFDAAAIAAQRRLPALQGAGDVWFCGAWTRHGFHEDGLVSALRVVDAVRARLRAEAPQQLAVAA